MNHGGWWGIAFVVGLLVVAALTLGRALASPLGVTALDAAAPIAFLASVLVLSVRLLVTPVAPQGMVD